MFVCLLIGLPRFGGIRCKTSTLFPLFAQLTCRCRRYYDPPPPLHSLTPSTRDLSLIFDDMVLAIAHAVMAVPIGAGVPSVHTSIEEDIVSTTSPRIHSGRRNRRRHSKSGSGKHSTSGGSILASQGSAGSASRSLHISGSIASSQTSARKSLRAIVSQAAAANKSLDLVEQQRLSCDEIRDVSAISSVSTSDAAHHISLTSSCERLLAALVDDETVNVDDSDLLYDYCEDDAAVVAEDWAKKHSERFYSGMHPASESSKPVEDDEIQEEEEAAAAEESAYHHTPSQGDVMSSYDSTTPSYCYDEEEAPAGSDSMVLPGGVLLDGGADLESDSRRMASSSVGCTALRDRSPMLHELEHLLDQTDEHPYLCTLSQQRAVEMHKSSLHIEYCLSHNRAQEVSMYDRAAMIKSLLNEAHRAHSARVANSRQSHAARHAREWKAIAADVERTVIMEGPLSAQRKLSCMCIFNPNREAPPLIDGGDDERLRRVDRQEDVLRTLYHQRILGQSPHFLHPDNVREGSCTPALIRSIAIADDGLVGVNTHGMYDDDEDDDEDHDEIYRDAAAPHQSSLADAAPRFASVPAPSWASAGRYS